MPSTFPADVLACPRCDRSPLARDGACYRCPGCNTEFPAVGGIPWLFADPASSLGEWRNRLHFELKRLAHEIRRLDDGLQKNDLPPLTRRRLERQAAATDSHRKALQKLLSPLDVDGAEASWESHLALRTRLPIDQALDTYYANVHRDWAWGEAENRASLDQVRRALAESPSAGATGDTLVLGAGACRLA